MALFGIKRRPGARISRATLRSMLQMDAARLNDMGLTRYDIVEALRESGNTASSILNARRTERATEWLR